MFRVLTLALVLSLTSAAALVDFTEVPFSSGDAVTTEWSAYNIEGVNTYFYIDARDTFDGYGWSNTATPGIIRFIAPVNGLSIDYALINGVVATFEIFDGGGGSLGVFGDDALAGDKNASHFFGGTAIKELHFSGNSGVIGISTLEWRSSASVPEPSTFGLAGCALAGLAFTLRRRK